MCTCFDDRTRGSRVKWANARSQLRNKQNRMNADKVQAYVDAQVQALNDRKVKPIIDNINAELEGQTRNNTEKARLDALNAESDKRIAALQTELTKAKASVNEFATKLAEATVNAVSTGQEQA